MGSPRRAVQANRSLSRWIEVRNVVSVGALDDLSRWAHELSNSRRGVLNAWERTNWEFGHYLARRILAGECHGEPSVTHE
jgi:hypothetical protein